MSEGEQVPVVLIPRYTAFAGAHAFTTIAMDVTAYSGANLSAWRGNLAGGGAYAIVFQESTDQVTWTTVSGGASSDPGADTEAPFALTFTKRWFRVAVTLTGTNPHVTNWCVGFLTLRLS